MKAFCASNSSKKPGFAQPRKWQDSNARRTNRSVSCKRHSTRPKAMLADKPLIHRFNLRRLLMRLTDNKIVLVTRPTRLAELVIRFNTVSQARFYVEHQGADFSDYLREDETYHQALAGAEEILGQIGRVQVVDRGFL